MSTGKNTNTKGYFEGLKRRLLKLFFLAIIAPLICFLAYALVINLKFGGVIKNQLESDKWNKTFLEESIEAANDLVIRTSLQTNESLVHSILSLVNFSSDYENSFNDNESLQKLLKFGDKKSNTRYSIISKRYGLIYLDNQIKSGSSIKNNLHYVHRMLMEPQFNNKKGSVWSVFYDDPDDNGKASKKNPVIAISTRITGTNYELAMTTRMPPEFLEEIGKMNQAVQAINKQGSKYGEYTRFLFNTTMIMIFLVIFIGVVLVARIMQSIKKRIIHPADELMETADAIREGNYYRRVDLSVMTEDLIELGYAVNRMLDTITRLIESEEDKKHLQQNIIDLLNIVSQASKGDFSGRGEVSDDVLGPMVDALNLMLDSISTLIVDVKNSGQRVTVSAASILETARKIIADAKRQGREIHQVTAMVQQASRSMQRVSISADMANEESQRATVAAKEGGRKVNDTIRNMQRIRSNVQATSKTIKMLGDRSLEINAIVEMINDISARTNILSLNAAIEASKAGEQGKGFAVVADEIRKLAERTTNATKDISSFIEDIQIETNDAVLAMEEVTREVELGWKQSDQAGTSLRQIQDVILSAAEKIMEISKVSSGMVNQMDSVVEDIKSIYQVTRETTEGIYRSTDETRGLVKPLNTLNNTIRSFRLAPRFENENKMDWILSPESILEQINENEADDREDSNKQN